MQVNQENEQPAVHSRDITQVRNDNSSVMSEQLQIHTQHINDTIHN